MFNSIAVAGVGLVCLAVFGIANGDILKMYRKAKKAEKRRAKESEGNSIQQKKRSRKRHLRAIK